MSDENTRTIIAVHRPHSIQGADLRTTLGL